MTSKAQRSSTRSKDLKWLLPMEVDRAATVYCRWRKSLDIQFPNSTEINHRKALNATYGTLAGYWGIWWMPLLLAAALLFWSNHALTIVFVILAAIPLLLSIVRGVQAILAYPHTYRKPPLL